jgi:hypothetical protein
LGFSVFSKVPKSVDVRGFLGRLVKRHGAPKYIISDRGPQFDCPGFKAWSRQKRIDPRYASAGSLRATAVVERFFLSLKDEWLRRIFVPLSLSAMRREISLYLYWFAEHRPHQGLEGRTPNEISAGLPMAKVTTSKPKTREIPRPKLAVRFLEGRTKLPIIEIKKAA